MTYYYHLLTFVNEYTTPIVLIFICLILAIFTYSILRNGATVEYIEDESEGDDYEESQAAPIPEDVKYRADWLSVFMNYLILSCRYMSEKPTISCFQPKDNVSLVRIMGCDIQFYITVYWNRHKVLLTGYSIDTTVNIDQMKVKMLAKKSFKWHNFDTPYVKIDAFLKVFENAYMSFFSNELFEKLTTENEDRDYFEWLINHFLDFPPAKGIEVPEDEKEWFDAVADDIINLAKDIKHMNAESFWERFGILMIRFAIKYGADWLQKFNFDQVQIEEILDKIEDMREDDGADQTAEESENEEE